MWNDNYSYYLYSLDQTISREFRSMNITDPKMSGRLGTHFFHCLIGSNCHQHLQNDAFYTISTYQMCPHWGLQGQRALYSFVERAVVFAVDFQYLECYNQTITFVRSFLLHWNIRLNHFTIMLSLERDISMIRTLSSWIKHLIYPGADGYNKFEGFRFPDLSCEWSLHLLIFLAEPVVIVTMLLKNHISPKVTATCTSMQVPIHSIQMCRNFRILLKVIC